MEVLRGQDHLLDIHGNKRTQQRLQDHINIENTTVEIKLRTST